MESALRPRDIQARIRAGETTEDVAAAAGTSVDSIMGFAVPVLAERAHVAQGARLASVRRSAEAATGARTLGEAADSYFAEHGLHDEDVEWDAWRRQDGRWTVIAEYVVGGTPRRAEFNHDVQGRFVVAENDDGRLLTGELTEPGASTPEPRAATGRRLSAVPAPDHQQDELPLGDDAIELVRDPAEPAPSVPADAEESVEHSPEPTAAPPAAQSADPSGDEQSDARPESRSAEDTPTRKKGRSSVPSWDEIMFGGSPRE